MNMRPILAAGSLRRCAIAMLGTLCGLASAAWLSAPARLIG